jgi:hypothetical protein
MGDWKLVMNGSDADSEEAPAGGAKGKGKGKKGKPKAAESGENLALYNLATDIGEKENLAAKEPERTATMRARLAEFLKDAVVPGQVGHEAAVPAQSKKKAR